MSDGPVCDDCGFPLSLMGRDRSGPEYVCFSCAAKWFREQREAKDRQRNAQSAIKETDRG
jgi:hypothetical protein